MRINTPKGEAHYPWLTAGSPDTKYNAAGVYKLGLLIDADDCKQLCEQLDALALEAYNDAVAAAKPVDKKRLVLFSAYQPECDDEGEETGRILFNFKMNASFEDKAKGVIVPLAPKVFDAAGKPIPKEIQVYGGSIVRVNFSPVPFMMASTKQAGVSLRLNAVQVVKLVQSGGAGGDGSAFGFEKEEGYHADQEAQDAFAETDVPF